MTFRRLRLRRPDGRIYLDRWGFDFSRGGIFIHRMAAPDPGADVHDHPYNFFTMILRGGYTQKVANVRGIDLPHWERLLPFTVRFMRLDEAHSITSLAAQTSWSLIIHGRRVRPWGFYVLENQAVGRWNWVESEKYMRGQQQRRGLKTEVGR